MPYCSTHGLQQGKHCPQCGAPLSDSQPAAGDSVRVRSPEATAIVNIAQEAKTRFRPPEVECPRCGHFNAVRNTFNCKGGCGAQNLCRRHFDEDYQVCKWCADKQRGIANAEAEHQAKLHADLASWRQRAEQAETSVVVLTQRSQQAATNLAQRTTALSQSQERVRSLEKELAGWRVRAERAEGQLAAIERARQDATAKKPLPVESPRPRAQDVTRQQPAIWQHIGIELVRIPAGEFFRGGFRVKVHLPEYWIAKTPVTNAEYAAFVQATGHPAPSHWMAGRIPAGKENHPVVNVSRNDAQMFCQWAGLRLPTEQEWEKAACGTDGRVYPWGDQEPTEKLCNFNMNVKDTTPVGQYPAGASPYGLLDMAGNVWEWCEGWHSTEQKSAPLRGGRYGVLRGGSWGNNGQYVCTTVRRWISPDGRSDLVGFRLAYSS